jgi:hypothetical protein
MVQGGNSLLGSRSDLFKSLVCVLYLFEHLAFGSVASCWLSVKAFSGILPAVSAMRNLVKPKLIRGKTDERIRETYERWLEKHRQKQEEKGRNL